MGRIREGWELTKKSWSLLRDNKQLFKFSSTARWRRSP